VDQSLINPPPKTVPQNWPRRCNGGDTAPVLLSTTGNTVAMSATRTFLSAQSLRRYIFQRQSGGAAVRLLYRLRWAQSIAALAIDKQGEDHHQPPRWAVGLTASPGLGMGELQSGLPRAEFGTVDAEGQHSTASSTRSGIRQPMSTRRSCAASTGRTGSGFEASDCPPYGVRVPQERVVSRTSRRLPRSGRMATAR
jgi:hypothetical protein